MTSASYGSHGQVAHCIKCDSQTFVAPLHGERGGPAYCFMCAGAWHAEHGRLRKAGRVLVRAMKAYEAAGGSLYGNDFDKLKLATSAWFDDDSKTMGDESADLTSELLDATIALTHPDKHRSSAGRRRSGSRENCWL